MTLYQMLPQMLLPETALIPRQIPLFFTSDSLSYTQHLVLKCILLLLLLVFLNHLTLCAKVASSTYSDIRSALVGLKTPY